MGEAAAQMANNAIPHHLAQMPHRFFPTQLTMPLGHIPAQSQPQLASASLAPSMPSVMGEATNMNMYPLLAATAAMSRQAAAGAAMQQGRFFQPFMSPFGLLPAQLGSFMGQGLLPTQGYYPSPGQGQAASGAMGAMGAGSPMSQVGDSVRVSVLGEKSEEQSGVKEKASVRTESPKERVRVQVSREQEDKERQEEEEDRKNSAIKQKVMRKQRLLKLRVARGDIPDSQAVALANAAATLGSAQPGSGSGPPTALDFLDASDEDPDEVLERALKNAKKRRMFVCNEPGCTKSYTSKNSFEYHVSTHTRNFSWSCPHPGCGMTFTARSSLLRHQRNKSHSRKPRDASAAEPLPQAKSATEEAPEPIEENPEVPPEAPAAEPEAPVAAN